MQFIEIFSLQFLLYLVLFLFSQLVLVCVGMLFVPQKYLIKYPTRSALVAISLGMVLFTAIGFVAASIDVRNISYIGLVGAVAFTFRNRSALLSSFSKILNSILKLSNRVKILAVVGVLLQFSATITSGTLQSGGVAFARLNSEDGILHLAFAESMKNDFPPMQPAAIGMQITNYHYWSDFYISELSRIFLIPINLLYFQFLPLTLAILLAGAIVILVRSLRGSEAVEFWTLFTHFFAGNATFLFTLMLHGEWRWNTPAIDHGILQFFNTPQAFARLFVFIGLITMLHFLRTKEFRYGLITAILFGFSVGYKVYFGFFAAVGMFFLVLYHTGLALYKKSFPKEYLKLLGVIATQAVISAIVYFPTNSNAGGVSFNPLFWPRLLLGQTNIEWNDWWLRMQVYEAAGNQRNILIFNAVAIGIFFISVYGSRIIGLLSVKDFYNNLYRRDFLIFIFPATILCTLIGMNFLQESGGANIFNFFIVSLMSLGILAGFAAAKLEASKAILSKVILALFVVLSVPRPIQDAELFLRSIILNEEVRTISSDEVAALYYLREHSDKNVAIQVHPNNEFSYLKSPYITVFSGLPTFLSTVGILESHNQKIDDRITFVSEAFSNPNLKVINSELRDRKIGYLYLRKGLDTTPLTTATISGQMKIEYENSSILILKVL